LQRLFDVLPDAILIVAAGGEIALANGQASSLFGYAPGELVGARVEDLLPESLRAAHPAHRQAYAADPRVRLMGAGLELVARRKDGGELPVDISLSPLTGEDGPLVVAAVRDVSERRQAQQALAESEARFRAIFESAQIGMCIVDSDGRAVRSNQAFQDMLGYTEQEIAGMAFTAYTYPDDVPANLALWQELVAGRRNAYELEKRYVRRDGAIIWSHLIVRAVRDDEGRIAVSFSLVQEITERKRAEEAALVANERFQLAATAVESAVYDWDIVADQCVWSEGLTTVFGYPLEEVEPDYAWWLEHVHPEDREGTDRRVRKRNARGEDWDAEYRFRARDGGYRQVLDRGLLVRGREGGTRRLVGGMVDLTELKALEEQLFRAQRMESVGRLAGGIAHDFNNILTVVTGYADLIRARAAEDDPTGRDAAEIRRAADRAAALVHQLLAYSRRQLMRPQVLDLNVAVAGLDEMLRRLLGEDVELDVALEPELGHARIDPTQLEQVVVNLAVNARDAMPEGGKLTIETANVELDESHARTHVGATPGRHVMLAVTDTGVGIDEETRAHLFHPFFTTKEEGLGTGLGLATVYGIVKQSGGSVWVYSEPGRGATFKIYLPRVDEPPDEPAPAAESAASVGGSETVLLAEEDESVRGLALRVLRDCGYTVLDASDGVEAQRVADEHAGPIHLLLTDVVMTRGGGPELGRWIAGARPGTKVLYMSGYTERFRDVEGALAAGGGFLGKPFTPSDLLRKVREVLDAATEAPTLPGA